MSDTHFTSLVGDTAYSLLIRASRYIDSARKQKKSKLPAHIYFYKFDPARSYDIEGNTIKSPLFKMDTDVLADIYRKISTSEKYSDVISRLHVFADVVENQIHIPALLKPSKINEDNLAPKSGEQVAHRLNRYVRRLNKEVKTLRSICPGINQSQNDRTISSSHTLDWLSSQYDGNDGISENGLQNIIDFLFNLTVKRESNRLFHYKRHPSNKILHRCHDEGVLAAIEQVEWALGGNPLKDFNVYNENRHFARF